MSSAEAPAVSLDWRLGEDIVADDDSGSSSKARDSASVSAAPPVGDEDAGNGEAADGEDSEAATTNQSDEVAESVKASLDSSEVDALLDVGRMRKFIPLAIRGGLTTVTNLLTHYDK